MNNIYQEYKNYLKDNPKNFWFKKKLYGWGWTPAKPQGWYSILIWLIIFIAAMNIIEKNPVIGFSIAIVDTLILLLICYKKGEKPSWQWGFKNNNKI